jgi:hypothetical protein
MVGVIFRDFLYNIDIESLLLGLAFVLILAIVMTVLGRFPRFRQNPAIKTVIAFSVSLLSIYGISKTRINLENIFYRLGFTEDLLYNVILIVFIGFFVVAGYARKVRKWRLYRPLILLGFMLTVASFTSIIYEKGMALAIGIPLLAIGIFLWWKRWRWYAKNRKEREYSDLKTKKRARDYEIKTAERAARRAQRKNKKKDKIEEKEEILERRQRQQRIRSSRELNNKYQQYIGAVTQIQRRNNGKIPALGTSEGNLRHRYIQALKAIEGLADKQGVKLKGRGKVH